MLSDNPIRWTDPGTWPWIVYVWVGLILAGWVKPAWRWYQRRRSANWPITQGRIESAEVQQPKRFFPVAFSKGRTPMYVAEIVYTYSFEGNPYAGSYTTELASETEAREFVRDLKGKVVAVHCNPNQPSSSSLSEPDIKVLLDTRAPLPGASLGIPSPNAVPLWLKPFLWVFVAISAVGLVVSLWVHLGAVMGRRVAPEASFWILHVGIFVVWFPAVFVGQRIARDANPKEVWRIVLRGAPEWVRYMVYGFFAYAFFNFLFFWATAPSGGSGPNPPAAVWRGFSGHWMAFYSAALAVLYSAARVDDRA